MGLPLGLLGPPLGLHRPNISCDPRPEVRRQSDLDPHSMNKLSLIGVCTNKLTFEMKKNPFSVALHPRYPTVTTGVIPPRCIYRHYSRVLQRRWLASILVYGAAPSVSFFLDRICHADMLKGNVPVTKFQMTDETSSR